MIARPWFFQVNPDNALLSSQILSANHRERAGLRTRMFGPRNIFRGVLLQPVTQRNVAITRVINAVGRLSAAQQLLFDGINGGHNVLDSLRSSGVW